MSRKSKTKKTLSLGCMISLSMFVAHMVPDIAMAQTVGNGGNLQFGSFLAGGSAGTVRIGVDDSRNVTGGVTGITSSPAAAVLQLQGDGNPIVLTISPSSVNAVGPGPNMTVDTFQIETSAGGPTQTVTPAATATLNVPIGATLHVGANQTAGSYSGTFNIDATYQ